MYEDIIYTVEDPVAIIEFNREDRLNAASDKMLAELRHAVAAAEADPAVVGIIITGKGRGFCAGRDVAKVGGSSGPSRPEGDGSLPVELGDPEIGEDYARSYAYLATIRKPVIAAINGACVGLGFVLAMMCDMRYIARDAFMMTAFSQRGLVAENGVSWFLPRMVGIGRALEILWSSRRVKGEEAERLGLAERCVDGEDLLDEAKAFIQGLADRVAPSSIYTIKKQLYRGLQSDFGSAFDESRAALDVARKGDDLAEGMTAFREKRKPNFKRIGDE